MKVWPNKKHQTSVGDQKNVSVTAGRSQMSFLSSATAEHILEANEGEEAKNAENCSNRKLNYLPNKKYLIIKKKG